MKERETKTTFDYYLRLFLYLQNGFRCSSLGVGRMTFSKNSNSKLAIIVCSPWRHCMSSSLLPLIPWFVYIPWFSSLETASVFISFSSLSRDVYSPIRIFSILRPCTRPLRVNFQVPIWRSPLHVMIPVLSLNNSYFLKYILKNPL